MQFPKFIITFILIAIKLISIQAKIEIIYQDVEVKTENEEYLKDVDHHVNDDNSAVFFNLTIVKDIPADTRAYMSLVGESMGQYVVRTPVNFNIELCQIFDSEHGGMYGAQFERLEFSGDDCPPSPRTHCNPQFTLDESVLPDNIPSNNYLLEFKLTSGTTIIYESDWYIRILS